MPSGSKPGERRGGRKKGTPNKINAGRRNAEKAAAEEVARQQASGAAPAKPAFDAKTQLEQYAMVLTNMIAVEQRKEKPDPKWIKDLIDVGIRACGQLLPYQHRRLGQIGVDVEALMQRDGTLKVTIASSDGDL